MVDILIKNGLILDGTGAPSFYGDISVLNGRIEKIESTLNCEARETIDAEGLVVSPGFIDVHSHNDLVPYMNEEKQILKLMQGVTTELVGQCGLGVVPCEEKGIWQNYIRGVVGDLQFPWSFKNFKEYIESISGQGLKSNYASLISHGAVRTSIMGFENRTPSKEEVSKMCAIVEDAMKEGAFGISIGLQYMPAIFSSKGELIEICSVVKKYDGIVMVHVRNHDNTMVKALDEIIDVAQNCSVKLHISHMRSYNSVKLGCPASTLIDYVEKAASKGLIITFDEHLYLSGSTLLTQLLPPWLTGKGTAELLRMLRNKYLIDKAKEELEDTSIHYPGWDNYSAIAGWKGILITSVKLEKNKSFIGRTVGEISDELTMHPVDFIAQLLIEEQGGVGIVTLNIFSEEDTVKLIKHPLQMVGSDSIPAGVPHPRLYGNYPLYLSKFVREKKAISLEEAVYKATGFPASVLGFKDRGEIKIGHLADITIFDFNKIKGYEDYRNPSKRPEGIKYVIVNGHIALRDGIVSKGTYGRVICYKEIIKEGYYASTKI